VPDETTILKFRHLLEKHHLGRKLFQEAHRHREAQGVKVTKGTIVDATIINVPLSTKNRDKERDPDMHQTRKGNQWYFGMKAHIGVDSQTKVVHTVALPAVGPVATAAHVHDATVLPDLLHGEETRLWGDSAYQGQTDVLRPHAPKAQDLTNRRYRYKGVVNEAERARNRIKSQIRSRVEHAFGVIKGMFHFTKVRYRVSRRTPIGCL
jgi:IS5 family transposase